MDKKINKGEIIVEENVMNTRVRESNGITLIALVITIVLNCCSAAMA